MNADEYLQLIAGIYDAAIEPQRWPAILTRIAEAFDGHAIAIHDKNFREQNHSFVLQIGFSEESLRAHEQHFLNIDPRLDACRHFAPGTALTEAHFISESDMDRSEYYQDFLAPLDMRYMVGGVLESSPEIAAGVGVQRSPRRGPPDSSHLEQFGRLLPHLQRALAVQRKLQSCQRREGALVDALDRLPHGVIVLDAHARPVLMNQAARAIIALNDGLSSGPDGLAGARRYETVLLRKLVGQALAHGAGEVGAGAIHLPRPSGKVPLLAWIVPSGHQLAREVDVIGPHILLFVSDPETRPHVSLVRPFTRFYGLTPAEARLVEALVNGASMEEARCMFSVSMATLRTQLRSVFFKTGTKRQTDLLRLVFTSPLQVQTGGTQKP